MKKLVFATHDIRAGPSIDMPGAKLSKLDKILQAINITTVSLEGLTSEGFDASDNGFTSDGYGVDGQILTVLTNRQRSVATLLNDGYTRKETAGRLDVSLQAVHQIVLRMRKRLRERASVSL